MDQWSPDQGIDITAAFQGLQIPVRELLDDIHSRGWTADVGFKDNAYVATAKNPHGEEVEKTGPTDSTALGNLLLAIIRKETIRYQGRTSAWKNNWVQDLQPIAQAYAEASIYDPKAAGAWRELADDVLKRAELIGQQVRIEFTPDPEPYKTIDEMCEDVRQKQHISIPTASLTHPLWTTDQMLAYRVVVDVLGHCSAGADWGWHGTNLAAATLMPLFNPEAQKALFTELVGQTAYNTVYRSFGPQKITFLEDELDKIRKDEQKPGHGGVHPSQTVLPGQVPTFEIKDEPPEVKRSSVHMSGNDPNANWQSGLDPLPDNAFLWQRGENGLDPLDAQGLRENAAYLDSGWQNLQHPDGTPDMDSRRQAVTNAFRAVLTGGRKPFQQNARHYQDISHVPARVNDPVRYWQTLEHQRENHNQGKGLPAGFHQQPYSDDLRQFRGWIKGLYPQLDDNEVNEHAGRELYHMLAEEEERVAGQDDHGELTTQDIEREAARAMHQRLAIATKPRIDEKFDFGTKQLFASADGGYGSFLASHMRPIAGVSHKADQLLDAANTDMANGGAGHHFRDRALGLGIPGVGPKEASYAWMLLAPRTSQLGVVNPEIAQTLGYKPEDMSDRDYFKLERELAAGRDASGYGHIPLGQFGWGLYDHATFGPGVHRDHTPLRPIQPAPYESYDWDSQPKPSGEWQDPYWWSSTQEARDQVARDWDQGVAPAFPKDTIPKIGSLDDPAPYYQSPLGAETDVDGDVGAPGEPLMQYLRMALGLTTEEIWALNLEAGKLDGSGRSYQSQEPATAAGSRDPRPQGAL